MTPDEEKIVLLIIILVVAAVTLYVEFKMRRIGVGKRIVSSRLKKDQAFNAMHTTKAVRNKLRIERLDTAKADYMISKAESAFEDGDYESCTDVCRQAREELLKCKREGQVLPSEAQAEAPAEPKEGQESAGKSEAPRTQQAAGVDNSAQLQAKFELKAAKADLEAYSGDGGMRQRASQLVAEAERQLQANDFQKSLSASFRARKLLSGEEPEEKAAAKSPEQREEAVEPAKKQEGRCGSCGAVLEPDDVFCHSCGAPLKAGKCESCGADLKGFEKFCRKCGKPAQ